MAILALPSLRALFRALVHRWTVPWAMAASGQEKPLCPRTLKLCTDLELALHRWFCYVRSGELSESTDVDSMFLHDGSPVKTVYLIGDTSAELRRDTRVVALRLFSSPNFRQATRTCGHGNPGLATQTPFSISRARTHVGTKLRICLYLNYTIDQNASAVPFRCPCQSHTVP